MKSMLVDLVYRTSTTLRMTLAFFALEVVFCTRPAETLLSGEDGSFVEPGRSGERDAEDNRPLRLGVGFSVIGAIVTIRECDVCRCG